MWIMSQRILIHLRGGFPTLPKVYILKLTQRWLSSLTMASLPLESFNPLKTTQRPPGFIPTQQPQSQPTRMWNLAYKFTWNRLSQPNMILWIAGELIVGDQVRHGSRVDHWAAQQCLFEFHDKANEHIPVTSSLV